MQECLKNICKEFETIKDFFKEKTEKKVVLTNKLFFQFLECFAGLKEEKFDFPKEFAYDVRLYNENYEPLVKKFEDEEIRYLMISDFYDFCRITKKI